MDCDSSYRFASILPHERNEIEPTAAVSKSKYAYAHCDPGSVSRNCSDPIRCAYVRADRVFPSGADRLVQRAPGMLVSIYGTVSDPSELYVEKRLPSFEP